MVEAVFFIPPLKPEAENQHFGYVGLFQFKSVLQNQTYVTVQAFPDSYCKCFWFICTQPFQPSGIHTSNHINKCGVTEIIPR